VYAGVRNTRCTRNDLLFALVSAGNKTRSYQAIPANELKTLATSIERTRWLLAKLENINPTVGIQLHRVGGNVVDVSPLSLNAPDARDPDAMFKVSPLIPINGTAVVKLHELLNAWHYRIVHGPRAKRSRPKEENTTTIVRIAHQFLRNQGLHPSSDSKNRFPDFVKNFYKLVTGTKPTGRFGGHIKKVLKEASEAEEKTPAHAPQKSKRRTGGKSPKK